ncbi:glycosyltransferase family 2 protein [Nostocales cyanobacterium LEGE 11386]|nr:glycosyltransferase family 2 protein [Nostocales cyanobacterium LEGE 11386]
MNSPVTAEPQVTIIVVPRERFSCTRESLESIYENTNYPFNLVYVDGNSPPHIQRYLEEQAQEKGFELIRTDYYLSPNQARNIGLRHVNTKYLVFYDNDVIVTPGWLQRLVETAEETEAAVVGPLICINQPVHELIHNAGGQTHIAEEKTEDGIRRRIYQKSQLCHRRVADVPDQLQLVQCDYVEFHCILIRTDIFERTGPVDEGLLATREHLDFCMVVSRVGGSIYCDRRSVVTYVQGPPFELPDLAFFMLRWSDAWELASLKHFREKWDLTEDKYFERRYEKLGHRRYKAFIKPMIRSLPVPRGKKRIEKMIVAMEKRLNTIISDRFAHKHPERVQSPVSEQQKIEVSA